MLKKNLKVQIVLFWVLFFYSYAYCLDFEKLKFSAEQGNASAQNHIGLFF